MNQLNKLNKLNSQYSATKFSYLCLKLEKQIQNGGYTEATPTHLAAAAIAVINCTYFGTKQESVDCVEPVTDNSGRIKEIEKEIADIDNKEKKTISDRKELATLTNELKTLTNKKQIVSDTDVTNRECDNVLATVASIYLSIIFHDTQDIFIQLINDLIMKKVTNCIKREKDKKKLKSKINEIITYFLNVVNKMNTYLENIGKTNNVSYEDIFTNAEYGKQDKKKLKKLKEQNPTESIFSSINKEDQENFRMVNQFIGHRLHKVNYINLHDLINKITATNDAKITANTDITALINKDYLKTIFHNKIDIVDTNNFIVFGIYTYDRTNNSVVITNPITYSKGNKYLTIII